MRFHHGKPRQLVAINLIAWTAGAAFLFRSCGPIEEERMAPAPQTPAAAAATGTKACGKHDCVFRLK